MIRFFPDAVLVCVCATLLQPAVNGAPTAKAEKTDALTSSMQRELQRAQADLGKLDPAPYFMSYSAYDRSTTVAMGTLGSLISSVHARVRSADVIVRVGKPTLDNTHEESRASALSSGMLPLNDDGDAIAHVLWQLTYGEYRKASQAYLNVKTKNQVQAEEEDTSPDFSQEAPQSHDGSKDVAVSDHEASASPAMEELARRYSGYFRKYPYIYASTVVLTEQNTRLHFVSTEGSRVVTSGAMIRLAIEASTRADDGMDLIRVETFQAEKLSRLPGEAEISARMEKIASDLKALRAAPVA